MHEKTAVQSVVLHVSSCVLMFECTCDVINFNTVIFLLPQLTSVILEWYLLAKFTPPELVH